MAGSLTSVVVGVSMRCVFGWSNRGLGGGVNPVRFLSG
ncbi:Uncharacterised protein [Mycobacteroides abscessus subsp. massiliense]|nr:Uncharacterised protein [Mycobacteroides abscessus subsp. massiliense]